MAVTTEQFEALTPIPYSQARGQLRTGDIVLFHSSALPIELIEAFTDSLWGHAAFVLRLEDVDSTLLLESVHGHGVRAVAMSKRVNGSAAAPHPYPGKLLALRHRNFPHTDRAAVSKMARFAVERLGYPYSMAEIALIASHIAAAKVGQRLPGHNDPQSAFVCSEYVAKSYAAMGIALAPDAEGFVAPADIANDLDVYPVCAICPDGAGVGGSLEQAEG